MWGRLSLTKKMALSVVLGLLIVFAGLGFLTYWILSQSTDRTLNERLLLAQVVAGSLDHNNESMLGQLEEFSLSVAPQTSTLSAEELSDVSSRLHAQEVMLVDDSGGIMSIQPAVAGAVGGNLYDLGYVSQGRALNIPYISGVVSSLTDGKSEIVYIVPLQSADGVTHRNLAVGVYLTNTRISGFVQAINLGKTGYTQVVDDKGMLIWSTKPADTPQEFDHGRRFTPLIEAKQAVVRTCHRCHEADSVVGRQKDVIAFAPLSSTSWGVAIRQAQSEALSPTRRLQEGMWIVGGSSLFLALAFSVTFMGRLVKPIRMLTRSSQKIAGGDLSGAIAVKGNDEVAILGQAFETMRVRLDTARKEIETRTEDIQRRKVEAEALYDIGVKISSLLDVEKILNSVVDKARDLLEADVAVLSLLEKEQNRIYIRATSGAQKELFTSLTLVPGQGFTGKVMELGRPLFMDDYLNDPSITHDDMTDSAVREEGLVSHLGVPLNIGDRIIGALTVAQRKPRVFSERETNLLARLANHAALAIDNARLYAEVQNKEELRGELLERIIAVQEDERKRIAQGLHDDLAQTISSLTMQLQAIETSLPAELDNVRGSLTKLRALSAHSLEDIRSLIADLRPMALDDLGLVAAIRWYANTHLSQQDIDIHVKSSLAPHRLPPHMETTLFRVAQEAINNITKHAEARNATITLGANEQRVRLTIEDDGKGFDVPGVLSGRTSGHKLGLVGMQERVALFRGSLRIQSKPGKGTTIFVEIPLERKE